MELVEGRTYRLPEGYRMHGSRAVFVRWLNGHAVFEPVGTPTVVYMSVDAVSGVVGDL